MQLPACLLLLFASFVRNAYCFCRKEIIITLSPPFDYDYRLKLRNTGEEKGSKERNEEYVKLSRGKDYDIITHKTIRKSYCYYAQ